MTAIDRNLTIRSSAQNGPIASAVKFWPSQSAT
jgi:hypothetical protein